MFAYISGRVGSRVGNLSVLRGLLLATFPGKLSHSLCVLLGLRLGRSAFAHRPQGQTIWGGGNTSPTGTLELTGTIDLTQFWPAAESDADTVNYEKPTQLLKEHSFVEEIIKPRATDTNFSFRTVGELYNTIEGGIVQLPTAIIGESAAEVGSDLVDFPDIVRVVNVDSAREAIHRVTHQGGGTGQDRDDCHFGIFLALRDALKREKKR